MLEHFSKGPSTLERARQALDLPKSTASHHVMMLEKRGMLAVSVEVGRDKFRELTPLGQLVLLAKKSDASVPHTENEVQTGEALKLIVRIQHRLGKSEDEIRESLLKMEPSKLKHLAEDLDALIKLYEKDEDGQPEVT